MFSITSNTMMHMPLKYLLSFFMLVALVTGTSAQQARGKMNVLFIAADDLNNRLSSYGDPVVKTPNLDRLARMGVQFDNAYNQYPLCSPSRVSLLTGLRPDVTRVYDLKTRFRDNLPTVITLPELFKKNGYFSARVGKIFHYGVPGDIGTDGLDDPQSWHKVINPAGRDKKEEHLLTNYTPGRGLGSSLSWMEAKGDDEEQTDGLVAEEAIRLLRENKDKPFFIAAGFYRPHCPYIAPKKYFDLYPLEEINLPVEPAEHFSNIPKPAFFTEPLYWGLTEHQRKEVIRAYYASISFMDAQVGKLLNAVRDLGLSDNTVIVFWSDHGYHLTEHGQWMKQSLFENVARVPLFIAAPGRKGNGRASKRIVELVDLYPTIAGLCGLTSPSGLAGVDVAPLLDDPAREWSRNAYTQVFRKKENIMGRSVRTERWRYTEWNDGREGVELYDHNTDPGEYRNLANDPAFESQRRELSKLLSHDTEK